MGSHRAPRDRGHGHGHGHSHGTDTDLVVAPLPRVVLLVGLAAAAVATVLGVFLLWPDSGKVDELKGSVGFAAEGVTFPEAVVDEVLPACPPSDPDQQPDQQPDPSTRCGQIDVTVAEGVDDGTEATVDVPPEVSAAGLEPGDRLELLRTPAADGQPATLSYFGIVRSTPLWLLTGLFALVVVAVARLRGLMALVGLGVAGAVVALFVLPALLAGESAVAVALVGASAIMYVVLYTTHGLSMRTSTALAGTLLGMVLTAAIGWWAVGSAHQTGVIDEGGQILTAYAAGISLQDVLIATVVIAGLGILNDVTITQASAVWELRAASPAMSRPRLFASAMRIGRDHIASAIYTIVFAYAGTALTLLLAVSLYDRSWWSLVGTEEISEEIVRSMVTSIGLVLAVPVTTMIGVLTVPGPRDGFVGDQTQ